MLIRTKYKVARRLGPQVFEKTQTQKFAVRSARKMKNLGYSRPKSDFGKALIEKQKARFTYGINERQFRKYVLAAIAEKKKNPAEVLYQTLETRLDNVVYRMHLGTTRRQSRQLVGHGHISVNGKRVSIPSYEVQIGDVVGIMAGSKKAVPFTDLTEKLKDYAMPSWVNFDTAKSVGKMVGLPIYAPIEIAFDVLTILEFYKR